MMMMILLYIVSCHLVILSSSWHPIISYHHIISSSSLLPFSCYLCHPCLIACSHSSTFSQALTAALHVMVVICVIDTHHLSSKQYWCHSYAFMLPSDLVIFPSCHLSILSSCHFIISSLFVQYIRSHVVSDIFLPITEIHLSPNQWSQHCMWLYLSGCWSVPWLRAILGPSWGHLWTIWGHFVFVLGPSWVHLGPY